MQLRTRKAIKPILNKAYGSIPHLPGSKFGNREDRGIPPGEARIFTEKCRPGDTIIVTEKLDGSCVAVLKKDGELIALNRAGYPCSSSPYLQHHMFAEWVKENSNNFVTVLRDGEWICGEWLAQAHGTLYHIPKGRSPFVAFDLFYLNARGEKERYPYAELVWRLKNNRQLWHVPILWWEDRACSIQTAMERLGEFGHYGAQEMAEGAVWRIERGGRCHALAKYVRPEKEPGKYLEGVTGTGPVWNKGLYPLKNPVFIRV